jgi:hypothetical protein
MNLKEFFLKKRAKPFFLSLSLSFPFSSFSPQASRPKAFSFFPERAQTAQLAQPATPPAQHRLFPFFF